MTDLLESETVMFVSVYVKSNAYEKKKMEEFNLLVV